MTPFLASTEYNKNMIIYLDIIFLENIFMNTIILFASGIILKVKIKIIRILISSIIGSTYAIILYTTALKIYSNTILKILLSVVMIYISFKPNNIKQIFKQLVIFYLTSFTFGGVAFALVYLIKPQDILSKNGVLIGIYPIKVILAGGIIGFIIITFAFKNIKGRITKKDMHCEIQIRIENKYANVKAIIDTGNFLKEPITKAPVIVVEKQALIGTLPNKLLDNLAKIINGEDINVGEYLSKIRIIPFSSLGKENGILLGIKSDSVYIKYNEEEVRIKDVIIGIYNGTISKNNKYSALVGMGLFEENYYASSKIINFK